MRVNVQKINGNNSFTLLIQIRFTLIYKCPLVAVCTTTLQLTIAAGLLWHLLKHNKRFLFFLWKGSNYDPQWISVKERFVEILLFSDAFTFFIKVEDQWQAFLAFTEQTFHYLLFQKYIHTPTRVILTTEKTCTYQFLMSKWMNLELYPL